MVVGCLLTILVAAGCGEDAQHAGDYYASVTADTVTDYLQNKVVTPALPADQQLAKIRDWLAAPSPDYIRANGPSELSVLSSTDQQIEIVVHKYGRTTALDGKKGAWGFACRRYTVDATSQLKAESIACPNGLSRNPNR